MTGVRNPGVLGAGVVAAICAVLYAAVSILRWRHWDLDSYDLAVYHQLVWHLSRFETPAVSIVGQPDYFGIHFSPILILLAPLYWIAQSPVMLMGAQALLIAAAVPAVHLYARRRTSQVVSLLLCVAFAQSWGVWAAADSPVHAVAFAVPLIAWAICFADAGRWRPTYACLAALVLVKEDLGLVVAAFGLVLAVKGEQKRGAMVGIAGIAAVLVVNVAVIPALSGNDWSARDANLYSQYGDSAAGAAVHLAAHPGEAFAALVDSQQKVRLVALLLGAFAALPLLSPWALLAVPPVAELLLADDPNLWGPGYHYALVPTVILAMAAADGMGVVAHIAQRRRAIPLALAGCAAAIALVSAAAYPLGRLPHASYWRQSTDERAAESALHVIPRRASVAGDWAVLAHVAPRDGMFLTVQTRALAPRYLVLQGGRGLRSRLRVGAGSYTLVQERGAERVYRRGSS